MTCKVSGTNVLLIFRSWENHTARISHPLCMNQQGFMMACCAVMVMTTTKNDDVDDDGGGDADGATAIGRTHKDIKWQYDWPRHAHPRQGWMIWEDIGMRWRCDTFDHQYRSLHQDNSKSQSCEHRRNIAPHHRLILKARQPFCVPRHGLVILISTDQSWASLHPKWGSISSLLSRLWISSTSLAGFSCLDPIEIPESRTSGATSLLWLWLWQGSSKGSGPFESRWRVSSWFAVFSAWDCKACTAKETAQHGLEHKININKQVFYIETLGRSTC